MREIATKLEAATRHLDDVQRKASDATKDVDKLRSKEAKWDNEKRRLMVRF